MTFIEDLRTILANFDSGLIETEKEVKEEIKELLENVA